MPEAAPARSAASTPPLAVAIPCYNEAPALPELIARWRQALPEAELVVFDNNSTDGTGALARATGVRVVEVPDQGKGYAVQAIFRTLGDRPAVILTDGDGTYPPESIEALLAPVRAGTADMVVGARRPVAGAGAMAPVRWVGNGLIRAAFAVLVGRGPGDLLSGYRVFGPRYLAAVRPRSAGFEIETELTAAAVAGGLRIVEVPVPYHPRAAGTQSKLHAVRDGRRILVTIVRSAIRLRPARLLTLAALGLLGLALAGRWLWHAG